MTTKSQRNVPSEQLLIKESDYCGNTTLQAPFPCLGNFLPFDPLPQSRSQNTHTPMLAAWPPNLALWSSKDSLSCLIFLKKNVFFLLKLARAGFFHFGFSVCFGLSKTTVDTVTELIC